MFLAYFIHHFISDNTKRQYLLIGFSLLLGVFLTQSILEILFNIITPNSTIVINYLVDEQYFRSLGLFNPVLLKNILISIIMIYFADRFKSKIPYYSSMISLTLLSVFWLAAFNNFAIIAARLATFFSISEPIIIAILLSEVKKNNKVVICLSLIAYSIIMILDKKNEFINITFGL